MYIVYIQPPPKDKNDARQNNTLGSTGHDGAVAAEKEGEDERFVDLGPQFAKISTRASGHDLPALIQHPQNLDLVSIFRQMLCLQHYHTPRKGICQVTKVFCSTDLRRHAG